MDKKDDQRRDKPEVAESAEETVDELRQRLNKMKQMMNERVASGSQFSDERPPRGFSIIDGSFLSLTFGVALAVILIVTVYAFYNLYHAILKRFPSKHTEL